MRRRRGRSCCWCDINASASTRGCETRILHALDWDRGRDGEWECEHEKCDCVDMSMSRGKPTVNLLLVFADGSRRTRTSRGATTCSHSAARTDRGTLPLHTQPVRSQCASTESRRFAKRFARALALLTTWTALTFPEPERRIEARGDPQRSTRYPNELLRVDARICARKPISVPKTEEARARARARTDRCGGGSRAGRG